MYKLSVVLVTIQLISVTVANANLDSPGLNAPRLDGQRPLLREPRSARSEQKDGVRRAHMNKRICGDSFPYLCVDRSYCVNKDQMCNGLKNCRDGSDEIKCKNAKKSAYMKKSICGTVHPYLCVDNSYCVYPYQVCDGHNNCDDGSDEAECETRQDLEIKRYLKKQAYRDVEICGETHPYICVDRSVCIVKSQVCNWIKDCDDGSDEVDCDPALKPTKAYKAEGFCPETNPYLCIDGSYCMYEHLICSGIGECLDGSDEFNCDIEEYYGTLGGKCRIDSHSGNTGWRDYADQLFKAHNYFRCLHGVPPLRYGMKLEKLSMLAAKASAAKGSNLTHSYGRFAENLAFGGRLNFSMTTGFGVIKQWYDEIKLYDYDRPVNNDAVGHFVTMMWDSYRRVGCGYARGPDDELQIACQYGGGTRRTSLRDSVKRPLYGAIPSR